MGISIHVRRPYMSCRWVQRHRQGTFVMSVIGTVEGQTSHFFYNIYPEIIDKMTNGNQCVNFVYNSFPDVFTPDQGRRNRQWLGGQNQPADYACDRQIPIALHPHSIRFLECWICCGWPGCVCIFLWYGRRGKFITADPFYKHNYFKRNQADTAW